MAFSYCRKHCGLYSCFVEPVDTSCPVTAIVPPSLQLQYYSIYVIVAHIIILYKPGFLFPSWLWRPSVK